MRTYVVTTIIGVFCVDENNKILSFKPFPKDPEKVAQKIKLASQAKEENQIAAENYIKENLRKLAVDYKFVKDSAEFNQFMSKVNIELAKTQIKIAIGRDSLITQANRTIEDIDKSINVFIERLREWYGLHFPEMDRVVTDNKKFVDLVESFGSREKIELAELQFRKSMGMDFKEEDVKIVQEIATKINEFNRLKKDVTDYLEKILKEEAPNFSELAGTLTAARLISKAGGLERLAKMPSSTIQLLGAEKALFRHLHGQGRSPRFGIIYFHPLVQGAPEDLKGKVARALASKLSMAAKIDFYSKEYRGDKLKKELQEKIHEIMKSEK